MFNRRDCTCYTLIMKKFKRKTKTKIVLEDTYKNVTYKANYKGYLIGDIPNSFGRKGQVFFSRKGLTYIKQ